MRHWFPGLVFIVVASCQNQACPSGGGCDPRNALCPAGYSCALAEICTRKCEQTNDCWVNVNDGCVVNFTAAQEPSEDGFCPESKRMGCIEGYCQFFECADGGCERDLYGPSSRGNRDQGPEE